MSDIKLDTYKCPKCCATIIIPKGRDEAICEYCGSLVKKPEKKLTTAEIIALVALPLISVILFICIALFWLHIT